MTPPSARRVLLVKAMEESDSDGLLIPLAERERANTHAGLPAPRDRGHEGDAVSEDDERFLIRRAELLAPALERRFPLFQKAEASAGISMSWVVLAAIAALLLGAATHFIGPARRINILAFPLVGLLAWNLLIYLLLFVRLIRRMAGAKERVAPPRWLPGIFSGRLARSMVPAALPGQDPANARMLSGLGRFAAEWVRVCAPMVARQLEGLLHLGAALLALGAVAAMYVRGLGFEYLAGWESTFLDVADVYRLLHIVLGPASVISGIPLPDAARIAELNWSAGGMGENAARWIHLYAVTAAIWIILPRLLLAVTAWLSARRMCRKFLHLDAREPYFRRILGAGRGGGEIARAVPYGFDPDAGTQERLRVFLHELWGERLHIDFVDPVAYGDEDDFVAAREGGHDEAVEYFVILMNLSSTPEDENQGAFIAGMARLVANSSVARNLLVLLDASGYRERMGEPGFAPRVSERRDAWSRMLAARGIKFAMAGAGTTDLEEARQAVWPPAEART